MKLTVIATIGILWAGISSASTECTAPESATKLSTLISEIFDGSSVICNDGNEFSTKFEFECEGNAYYSKKDKDDLTRLPDGSLVYIVTKLLEVDGKLAMIESSYADAETFENGGEPIKEELTGFVSYSERSFAFYSREVPTTKSWISSTWFKTEAGTAKGYKLFADRAVTCEVN